MNNRIMYNGQVLVDFDALADKYTRAEVDALVSSVFKYCGTVATYADLTAIPTADLRVGDCYNVEADGANYAWDGTSWDKLSGTVDLSNYYTKTQVDTLLANIDLSNYYTKTQVDSKVSTDIAAAITAIPVSDLLHFKGHVNSVEDLPSAGQPSAPEVAPILSIGNSNVSSVPSASTITKVEASRGAYNYVIWTGYSNSARCYLKFNDYSVLDGCCPISTSRIAFHFDASSSKPVIIYGSSDFTKVLYDDGTEQSLTSSEQTFIKPFWMSVNTYNSMGSSVVYNITNLNFNVKLKFPPVSTGYLSSTYATFKASSSGRNYIEDYYLLQPHGMAASQISWFKYYNGEPSADAKENNVYSVGSNNLLYRCNNIPAWELLSKQDKPLIVTYDSTNNTADYTSAQIKTTLDTDTPVYLHVEQINGAETINLLLPFVYADDTEAQAVLSNSYSSSGNESSSTITYSIDANGDGTMYNVANVTNGELSDALEDYLATDNTTPYTPTGDYNPATKKYVDTSVGNLANDISTLLSNFAPNYDNTSTYAVSDYVIYNKLLYVCTTAVDTAEDFDSNKWTRTTVSQMINNNA